MHTEFTSQWLLRWLKQVSDPSPEEIVDEMLSVLEFREQYVQKQIAKHRRREHTVNELFLAGFTVNWEDRAFRRCYASDLEALRGLEFLDFEKRITFFVGENGSGKSTLLEGLAIACGLNPEGGTQNFEFSTYDDYSALGGAVKPRRGLYRPDWNYFLRAESFYNVASVIMERYNDDGRMPDYHARSHGESFLDFIRRYDSPGLYLMDEPEAALSPQRQLELLIWLVQQSKKGAQFIIATHSPILLGTPGAQILSFDGKLHPISYEETESFKICRAFVMNREGLLRQLLRDIE